MLSYEVCNVAWQLVRNYETVKLKLQATTTIRYTWELNPSEAFKTKRSERVMYAVHKCISTSVHEESNMLGTAA